MSIGRQVPPALTVRQDTLICTVCRSFNQDAGKDYANSATAKILFLRRIDLHDDKIDIKLKLPVTASFVTRDTAPDEIAPVLRKLHIRRARPAAFGLQERF